MQNGEPIFDTSAGFFGTNDIIGAIVEGLDSGTKAIVVGKDTNRLKIYLLSRNRLLAWFQVKLFKLGYFMAWLGNFRTSW